MKPGDRLITALVGQHHTGETFQEWLLHVTIVPWFDSGISSTDLAQMLAKKLRGIPPFEATVNGEERLGYRNKKMIHLIRQPSPFTDIYHRVERMLKELHIRHVGSGDDRLYRPHITVQASARANKGDTFRVDRLYIISQQGGFKEIETEVLLHA